MTEGDLTQIKKANLGPDFLSSVQLFNPSTTLKEAYLKGFSSLESKKDMLGWIYLGDDANVQTPLNDFNKYVETLLSRETKPPEGFVCDTIWWAIYENEMIGRISFRHELNEFLEKVGGHIGYIVHPHWRSKGVATWMLREVLKNKRVEELGKVLVTCDESNHASEKTIVRNGGVFEKLVDLGETRPPKKHFWITV